jgi:hypothetical protein
MTKATDKIQELIEEINDTGLSGSEGIYKYVSFEVHHNDVDVNPTGPVKMNINQILWASNILKNDPRVVVLEGVDPVICKCLVKRAGVLDIHVTCSSLELQLDMARIMAESRMFLDKFCRDVGFTPGTHHYNILDAVIPWESVRTVNLERTEEGWT